MKDASQQASDRPGVSIIVTAYNYANFLPEAIQSALNQRYTPVEVIVVDDGSTDDTPQVLAKITDPRLVVIRQENAGLSAARNTGIGVAKYPFVTFLDADDRLTPQFLEKLMGRLSELPAEYAICASLSQRMTVDGQLVIQPKGFVVPPCTLTARDFILRNRVPCTVVVRRSVFEECGVFDTTLKSSEDRDMWIRITTRYKASYVDEVLVHIRRHGQNMSKHAARMRANTGRTLSKAYQSGYISPLNIPFWAATFSYFNFTSAGTFFSAGNRFAALKYIALSFLQCPFFFRPSSVGEKALFRLRALRHFLISKAETAVLPIIPSPNTGSLGGQPSA